MEPLASIQASQLAVANLIAEITANPMPNYSVNGVSYSWSEYLKTLTDQMAALQEVIIFLSGPYQLVTVGVT